MISSMTAFARQTQSFAWGTAVWEIRSVNHRYLEPSFKLPDSLRRLEHPLRERLRQGLDRGKVECSLRIQQLGGYEGLSLNQDLLLQLINSGEAIQRQLKGSAGLDPLKILQWPGVIQEQQLDNEQTTENILALFETALQQLQESRQREGQQLAQFLLQRLETTADITAAVRKQMPTILQAQRQKLQERLAELQADVDAERIEQEFALLIQKADVDEEMDRLDTHVEEVRRVLDKGGVCGRRLDFLMQELNREANTLSSKSIVSDTTQAAVELKVLIEQMREQIQNIE